AALDIIQAQVVEHAGDGELVGQREIDAIGLRAVPQRGVEQIDAFLAHADPAGAVSAFFIVVLLSHSLPTESVLRRSAVKPRWAKNSRAVSLASTERCAAPRETESFSTAS